MRRIIELARRGFHWVGLDIHQHRPNTPHLLGYAQAFQALVNERDRASLLRGLATNAAQEPEASFLSFCAANFHKSRAQLMQDLFALHCCDSKRGGFFVEFGATDGIALSNTFLLEREYAWTGILAEPARSWQPQLRANRNCVISNQCVWHTTGQTLLFNEPEHGELSTLDEFSLNDGHRQSRLRGERYAVETVSLTHLLEQNNAPKSIDYLSVDTEGSEFEILKAFAFEKYDVKLITVEHNFTPMRAQLHDLLVRNGYSRKFEAFSQWDDWYVRQ